MATGNSDQTVTSDLTDEELVTQFCLQNKVSKAATEALLKRGFTSLEALKLVEMDDISVEKIPRGQRRLILHISRTLLQGGTTEETSGTAGKGTTDGAATTTANPSVANVQIVQEVEQDAGVPGPNNKTNENTDIYSSLMNNMLAQQQSLTNTQACANSASSNGTLNQPSWNDPQIHISSASGKSVVNYLDICDFVQSSVEEELVLGGQGDQQIIVKSGPKKPRLENLTLSQWSVANLSILYKLVSENKLIGTAMMDYLSYTTKVYQLVQRFSLVSVLLYDREYRKLQATMGYRWGADVQHLHTLFLQPRDKPTAQASQQPKKGKPGGPNPGRLDKNKEIPVCRNFNSQKGCTFPDCKYRHVCLLPGCFQKHSVQTHVIAKN